MVRIVGLGEDPLVEREPGEFAVDEPLFEVGVEWLRLGGRGTGGHARSSDLPDAAPQSRRTAQIFMPASWRARPARAKPVDPGGSRPRSSIMHMLHLMRHAKSRWKEDVDDHERGLARRGREAARHLGETLPGALGMLDLVLVSSAVRTRQTLELVLAGFAPPPPCRSEDELYMASGERLLEHLRRLPEAARNVLVIGHNPGLRDLALGLADPAAPASAPLFGGKFPTAARVSFRLDAAWSELGRVRLVPVAYAEAEPGGRKAD
jgi:phosphohistidine phosphatase